MHLNVKFFFTVFVTIILVGVSDIETSYADETVKEKAAEVANDSKRAVKKGARIIKDKTCEMVDGKMKCVGKKIKHSVQNAGDKIEDAVD